MTGRALLKKEILFKATHRGSKETDLLLGGFAQEVMETLSEKNLILLLLFLEQDDQQISYLLKDPQSPLTEMIELYREYLTTFQRE
jgi:antitoxin CptB